MGGYVDKDKKKYTRKYARGTLTQASLNGRLIFQIKINNL